MPAGRVAALGACLAVLAGCGTVAAPARATEQAAPGAAGPAAASPAAATALEAAPQSGPGPATPAPVATSSAPIAASPRLANKVPPAGRGGLAGGVTTARLFIFADSQLHHLHGKRTFAQSPFADRSVTEVAIRPAALDDGSDLLLGVFLDEYRDRYPTHALVFLGDAADLSCTHEFDAFTTVVRERTNAPLLGVTSNHDGFFVGNYTSKKDLDGLLAATDMPNDWTRACAEPNSFADHRLTKGRAVMRLAKLLPAGPTWATELRVGSDEPTDHRRAGLAYLRQLGGGDPGAPPVWGVFLDTVDYRGFDLEASHGAGAVGSIAHEQLRFLDVAMFEAKVAAAGQPITFVVFGHHPFAELDPKSQDRLRRFFENHPEAAAYVSAHTHVSMERSLTLADGRVVPELIAGSTTDAPQAARLLEVQLDPSTGARAVASDRLMLDAPRLCAGIEKLPADAYGYTAYRLLRERTGDLDLGTIEKIMFALDLDNLSSKRAIQGLGALLVENELVRALAMLYSGSPLVLAGGERAELDRLVGSRFAAGQSVQALQPYLRRTVKDAAPSKYNRWHDPAIAGVLGTAELGLHRFAAVAPLFRALRERRSLSDESHRYFLCHAIYAAEAEASSPRRQAGVLYIR